MEAFLESHVPLNTTSFERVGCTFHIKMQMAFVAKIAIFQVQSYVRIWSQLVPHLGETKRSALSYNLEQAILDSLKKDFKKSEAFFYCC